MNERAVEVSYLGAATALAVVGLVSGSTALILLAVAVTLPLGAAGLVGYYAAYGLLSLVPGANPSHATGSTSCTADGACTAAGTGDPATWFVVTADVLGVTALVAAAVGNVLLWHHLRRRRRSR